MRFVEAIARKFFDEVEYFYGQGGVDTLCGRALLEHAPLLGHFFGFLLTHGPPQQIRTAQRITRQHLSDLHDLLLIQDDAVGGFENGLQPFVLVLRVRISQRLAAVLSINKIFYHPGLQRTRAEQRNQRDDVFEAIGAEVLDQLLHASAFKLEYRSGIAALQ